jgi:hypothetical protein
MRSVFGQHCTYFIVTSADTFMEIFEEDPTNNYHYVNTDLRKYPQFVTFLALQF